MRRNCTEPKGGDERPKVLMYYTYADRIGGPLTYMKTVMNSPLQEKYRFAALFQNEAPGGLNLPLLRRMTAAIRREKPDIVHVQGAQSEGFYGTLAARLAGCRRIVLTVHGFNGDDRYCPPVKRFLYRWFVEPLTLRMAHRVFCVCEYAAKRRVVTVNAGRRNRGFIHNCVPEMKTVSGREEVRRACGFGEEDVVFCISGRLIREKGFEVLAQAANRLAEDGAAGFRLLVLGDGDYREEFRRSVKALIEAGVVVMTGATDRVADYLAASDVFVLPSFRENLSIALLEAGASGLPCIVSAAGGNADIIRDGESGFVIDGFDPGKYAEKMRYLMENPSVRRRMREEIRRDMAERFSAERMCEQLDEVYGSHARRARRKT